MHYRNKINKKKPRILKRREKEKQNDTRERVFSLFLGEQEKKEQQHKSKQRIIKEKERTKIEQLPIDNGYSLFLA